MHLITKQLWAITFSLLVLSTTNSLVHGQQPNIVLVMADDQGWGDMAYNGHAHVKTPNFDEAARSGLNFNRFYAAAPVCSPTRASVLTGRHPNRMGVFKWGYPLRPQEVTIAEVLRDHGYRTAHFGKWHLGSVRHNSGSHPGKCGFDYWISAPNYFDNDPVLCNNGKAEHYTGESSMITADLAIDWITKQSKTDEPFFVVVWFGSPHDPHRAAEEDRAIYSDVGTGDDPKLRNKKMNFLGEVTGMDRAFGKLRSTLRDLEIDDNTIVWYTSDNGALPQVGSTGGLRGQKGKVYDGGLQVPSIIIWPTRIKAPLETNIRGNTCDIFPTLMSFAGIKFELDRPMDGTSLNKLVQDPKSARNKPMGFWDYDTHGRGVPSDKLMKDLLKAQSEGKQLSASEFDVHSDRLPVEPLSTETFPGHSAWIAGKWKLHRIEKDSVVKFELYNIDADRAETNNVVDENQEVVRQMQTDLTAWLTSVVDSYNGKDF